MDSFDAAELIPKVLRDRAVFPVYQPIVDLESGTQVGVEALARGPAHSPVEMPSALFAAASQAGLLALVDQLCFARAIETARGAADLVPPLLFANAEPAAINQPMLPHLLAAVREERRFRIVMEYTERGLTSHPAALLSLANFAHREGNVLALDDVGVDPMSLALLPLLEPEVVKLDIQLLRNPHSRKTVETAAIVGSYAERTGAMVVAEGIETETDLETAKALGAHWGQGWLFGRPGPLTRIAGRRAHGSPMLRSSQPDLHVPSGSPFSLAAAGRRTRAGDRRTVDELSEYLLSTAARGGSHTVILGVYPDPVVWRGMAGQPPRCGRHGCVRRPRRTRDTRRWLAWDHGGDAPGRHRVGPGRDQFARHGCAMRATCLRRDYGARGHPRTKSGVRGGAKAHVDGGRRFRAVGPRQLRQGDTVKLARRFAGAPLPSIATGRQPRATRSASVHLGTFCAQLLQAVSTSRRATADVSSTLDSPRNSTANAQPVLDGCAGSPHLRSGGRRARYCLGARHPRQAAEATASARAHGCLKTDAGDRIEEFEARIDGRLLVSRRFRV